MSAIISRGQHERTNEAGALLNAPTNISKGLNGTHAQEIIQAGSCFIGRTPLPHPSVPTVRYYALTRRDARLSASWGILPYPRYALHRSGSKKPSYVPRPCSRMEWLNSDASTHPAIAFLIATLECANCSHYYNVTSDDARSRILSLVAESMVYAVYLHRQLKGAPEANTLVMALLLYFDVISGLSSVCGVVFFIWRRVV